MAIAFVNAVGNGYGSGGGDLTVAGTVGGGADILVAVVHQFDTNAMAATPVTWNGDGLTLIGTVQKQGASNDWVSAYYLLAPDVGSFNLVADRTDANRMQIAAACYSGALQSGQPDASTGGTQGLNTSASSALASVADNCWHIFGLIEYVGGASGTVNATVRSANTGNGGVHLFDSDAAKTPAGSVTQTATFASSSSSWKQFTVAPAAPTTGIKAFGGLAYASTKTVGGLAVASAKTWNGLA
jgi:hypothetical protein